MHIKVKRKIISIMIILTLLSTNLIGCSKNGEAVFGNMEGDIFQTEMLELGLPDDESVWSIEASEHKLFFRTIVGMGTGESTYKLYISDKEEIKLREIAYDFTPGLSVMDIDEDGYIYLCTQLNGEKDPYKIEIVKIDEEGNTLMRATFDTEEFLGIDKMIVDKDKKLCFCNDITRGRIYIFNLDTEALQVIDEESIPVIRSMARGKRNEILVSTMSNKPENIIKTLDYENMKLVNMVTIPETQESGVIGQLIPSKQYDICYHNDKGIWAYDAVDNKIQNVVSFRSLQLSGDTLTDIEELGKDTYIGLGSQGLSGEVLKLSKNMAKDKRQVLTLGCVDFNDYLIMSRAFKEDTVFVGNACRGGQW